jgi:undecaprenyl-diphosphatase
VERRRWAVSRRARIVAGLVTLLGGIFVVLALSLRLARGTAIDVAVTHALQRVDAPPVTALMVAVSAPGYAPWSWLVLATASVALLLGGLWREAIFVVLTDGAPLLSASIKLLVERPRPTSDVVRVAGHLLDYSYPSGHVVGYVTLGGFLIFVLFVRLKPGPLRTLGMTLLGAMIALVGVSRIMLGYHWFSDVLGGYALGTAYLLVLIEIYRYVVLRPARASQSAPSAGLTPSAASKGTL